MRQIIALITTAFGIVGMACAAPTTVTLTGTIANSCTLAIGQSGVLVATAAGTQLRSDTGTGARAATLTVAATGANPTLTFSAPAATGPSGFAADSVLYSYSLAISGASGDFSSASGRTASSRLVDTATIHGIVNSATGFPAGTYTETVDVTCG